MIDSNICIAFDKGRIGNFVYAPVPPKRLFRDSISRWTVVECTLNDHFRKEMSKAVAEIVPIEIEWMYNSIHHRHGIEHLLN